MIPTRTGRRGGSVFGHRRTLRRDAVGPPCGAGRPNPTTLAQGSSSLRRRRFLPMVGVHPEYRSRHRSRRLARSGSSPFSSGLRGTVGSLSGTSAHRVLAASSRRAASTARSAGVSPRRSFAWVPAVRRPAVPQRLRRHLQVVGHDHDLVRNAGHVAAPRFLPPTLGTKEADPALEIHPGQWKYARPWAAEVREGMTLIAPSSARRWDVATSAETITAREALHTPGRVHRPTAPSQRRRCRQSWFQAIGTPADGDSSGRACSSPGSSIRAGTSR